MSDYGWIITQEIDLDHFDDTRVERWRSLNIMGPSDIPDDLLDALNAGEGEPFVIYDDDGVPYHKGRAVGVVEGHEPLIDFSGPTWGATFIEWPNSPELDSQC